MSQDLDHQVRKAVVDFCRQAPRRYPLVAGTLGILIIVLIIWFIPQWQVPVSGLSLKDRLHQINENRKTVAQIVGGVFILVGLYIAWVRSEAAKKMAEGDKERRITDLYVKAIEQLGSEKLQIRLGGIYALERIARESPKDHWPIMEVLTAFVRVNAPRREEEPTGLVTTKETPAAAEATGEEAHYACTSPSRAAKEPPADIQAVLTVLGRTAIPYFQKGEKRFLNLQGTYLVGADLYSANFQMAKFWGADLQGAFTVGSDFQKANFARANLNGSVLWGANFQEANFASADLQGVNLHIANLRGTILKRTILVRANLIGADLREAKDLTPEQVAEAIWDETTLWPVGFSPPPPRTEEDNEDE